MVVFSVVILLTAIIFPLAFFVYMWSLYRQQKLRTKGVGFLSPVPLFGNLWWSLAGYEHLSTTVKSVYDAFPKDRFVALWEFTRPTIVIKDLELIKKITVKDFDIFHDIPFQIDESVDPVFGRIIRSLEGQQWRQMRSTISPAFTGAKMKSMINFMLNCADKAVSFYEKETEASPGVEIEIRDLASRYTIDVIASAAFSFEVDSFNERRNTFYNEVANLSENNLLLVLKFTGYRLFPNFMKFFGIRLMTEDSVSYFRKVLHNTLTQREASGEYRPDMIHLLIEAKKGNLKHETSSDNLPEQFATAMESAIGLKSTTKRWTDDDLIAQAIVFILAGFGTSSTSMSFLIHELALNQDIQDRLRAEIDDVLEENDQKINYNALMQMKYMDMVITECLRKWPPIPYTNRRCLSDYDLGPVSGEGSAHYQMKKGETAWIPIYSVHMDPEYWPEPMKFDPERFSDANKKNINPMSYLPFGAGPRNCIGSRFALMEMKIMIFHFLAKFDFRVSPKTSIPINLSTKTLFMESVGGFWVAMKSRKDSWPETSRIINH